MFVHNLNNIASIFASHFNLLKSAHPILSKIGIGKTIHGGGHSYKNEQKYLDTPLSRIGSKITVKNDSILNFAIEEYCCAFHELVNEHLKSLVPTLLDTCSKITDFTGQVVDGRTYTNKTDMFIDTVKTLEITFDDEGKVIPPMLLTGTEGAEAFSKLEFSAEQQKRLDDVIEDKRKQFYAKKRNRRLSVVN